MSIAYRFLGQGGFGQVYLACWIGAKHKALIVSECGHHDRCVSTTPASMNAILARSRDRAGWAEAPALAALARGRPIAAADRLAIDRAAAAPAVAQLPWHRRLEVSLWREESCADADRVTFSAPSGRSLQRPANPCRDKE